MDNIKKQENDLLLLVNKKATEETINKKIKTLKFIFLTGFVTLSFLYFHYIYGILNYSKFYVLISFVIVSDIISYFLSSFIVQLFYFSKESNLDDEILMKQIDIQVNKNKISKYN